MEPTFWTALNTTWIWLFWIGMILLVFSNAGSWGYTYQAHRKFRDFPPHKNAIEILSERYAKGDINMDQYNQMRGQISSALAEARLADVYRSEQTFATVPL